MDSEYQPSASAFFLGLGESDALFHVCVAQLQDTHAVNTVSHITASVSTSAFFVKEYFPVRVF